MGTWIVVTAGLTVGVIVLALGLALVIYQRRFLAMHRSYADGLLTAQEQERAAVAREVHDDALQRVMILMHELDDWSGEYPQADTARRFGPFRTELEDLSASLRKMAYRLHPTFAHEEGLVPMLKRLAGEVQRGAGVAVEVESRLSHEPRLTSDQSLAVYRIAQEALSNVARHAGKTRAVVRVADGEQGALHLTIEDYGVGFDTAELRRRGLGLISMSERARLVGGALAVDSHPGGGTRVELKLSVTNGVTA